MGFSRSHNNELNSVVRGRAGADTPMSNQDFDVLISIQDFDVLISIQDFDVLISIQDFDVLISIQDFDVSTSRSIQDNALPMSNRANKKRFEYKN